MRPPSSVVPVGLGIGFETPDTFEDSLLNSDQISALEPPEWLVEDYLARDTLALLYGPSGASKTFLAIDYALHVATGSWWNGRAVKQPGRVFYVIAEGVAGVGQRLGAWKAHHKVYDLSRHEPITWRPKAVNLLDVGDVALLQRAISYRQPSLVVVDTLARCIVGGEENSAKDMGLVVHHLDQIRRTCGACVLIVHHTGKDVSAGARGNSALRAGVDTELSLTATDDRLVLKVTKQKDAAEALPVRLDRVGAEGSCVLVPSTRVREDDDGKVTAKVLETLGVLRSMQVPEGVATTVWMRATCEATGLSERMFYGHRAALVENGLVSSIGTDSRPRYVIPNEGGADALI